MRHKLLQFEKFLSKKFHPKFPFVVFILFLFIVLVLLEQVIPSILPYTEYFYVILIALSGVWFGLEGGFISATIASFIFISNFHLAPHEILDLNIMNSIYVIFFIYFVGGISVGYLSGRENRLKEKLKILAQYDELTGCLNYRWTMQILEEEILRCKRYDRKLSLILIDIDYFKKLNDTYGHLVGNDILKAFATTFKNNLRNVDIIGRYGGEEFLVILPESEPDKAIIVLNRIKNKLSQVQIKTRFLKDVTAFSIKFSAGIVSFPENGTDINTLISMADYALYKAKNFGRDMFIIEKRRWLRFKPIEGIKVKIICSDPNLIIDALDIIDISQNGLQLLLAQDISKKHEITTQIFFPDEESPSEVNCKVVYSLQTNEQCYRTGVCFINPSSMLRAKLLKSAKNPAESIIP